MLGVQAVAGGAVLAAAAGASRTESADPRFLTASHASDTVAPGGSGPSAYFSGLPGYFGALARLPGVGALAPVAGLNLEPLGHGGQTARGSATLAPPDRRFGPLRVADQQAP